MKTKAADLFCGLGGTSEGFHRAMKSLGLDHELVAVNHWPIAISSHQANHEYACHYCAEIEDLDPKECVPGGHLDILVASPECIHFSTARGGKPMSDQSRASATYIKRWATELDIDRLLIENVREFATWGPLDEKSRPIKKEKGRYFLRFIADLEALGYKVEYRVLNAADYGDATSRRRLFIQARKDGKPIIWPGPCFSPAEKLEHQKRLYSYLRPWYTARNRVIDWNMPSQSIFARKKPLAKKTLQRIEAGLRKFGGPNAEPFLVILRHHMDAQTVDGPVPTIAASGQHIGLCEPVLIKYHGGERSDRSQSLEEPLKTVDTSNRFGLVEPSIVNLKGQSNASSVDKPTPTITARAPHLYLAEPFILPHRMFERMDVDSVDQPLRTIVGQNGRGNKLAEPVIVPFFGENAGQAPRAHSVDDPLPTVTSHGAGALVEPHLIEMAHGGRLESVDEPLRTVTSAHARAVVEPHLVDISHGADPNQSAESSANRRVYSVDEPLKTITGSREKALCEPYLIRYNGTGSAESIDSPVGSISTKDRYALVMPDGSMYGLDIRLRMLKAHELAAATSLNGYTIYGTLEQQVKQIGNAVPRRLAQSLVTAMFFEGSQEDLTLFLVNVWLEEDGIKEAEVA